MQQFPEIWDRRQSAWCAYCAGDTRTRGHAPSRVLLEAPYPENLPVVRACRSCNAGFSEDEEYVACLVECVLAGDLLPAALGREKIQRILSERPTLAQRLAKARSETEEGVRFSVEEERVRNVLLKLARG